MLKKFVRSALFMSLISITASATAESDVDFNTTHVYSTDKINKQLIIDGLRHAPIADLVLDNRWNMHYPLGTPFTIKYAFSGKTIGGRDVRDFYPREKELIVSVLDSISRVSGLTFVEDDPVDRTESYHFLFQNIAGDNSLSGLPNNWSCPIGSQDDSECEVGSRSIDLSVTGLLDYLNPQREFDETDWIVDYKLDLSKAKSELLYHILRTLGVYPSDNAGVGSQLTSEYDNKFYTLMSPNIGNVSSEVFYPTDLKKFDVAVLQHLYGKAENTNTGDTLYTYDDAYDFHQLIYDVDGIDTLSVVDTTRNNIIDLRAGAFSSIAPNPTGFYDKNIGGEHLNRSHNSLSIDVDTVIENAIGGSGDDRFVANSVENTIQGGDGTDTVMFAGTKSDYTIEFLTNYKVLVTAVADSNDIDTLTDIEVLKFVTDFSTLGTDQDTAEVVILNNAPVITLPETISIRETLQATITATASDHENDDLIYTWSQVDGTEVILSGTDTLNVSFVAPAVEVQETINLQLEVSDGTNTTTKTVAVNIIANNMPSASIVTSHLTDNTVDEGTKVSLSVAASDADNSDTHIYRWVVSGVTVALTGDTTDTITFTAPDVTTDTTLTVEVFVSDGIDEVSATSTLTVKNVEAPVFLPTPEEKKSSGGSFGYFILLIAGLRLFRK